MLIESDLRQKLIALTVLRDRDATGVKILLQAAIAPLINQSVKCLFLIFSSSISCLRHLFAAIRSRGIIGARRRGGGSITSVVSLVAASESDELIASGALRNLYIVLIQEFLELAVRPSVEYRICNIILCVVGVVRCGVRCRLEFQGCEAGVTADTGNELVAGRWLGCGISVCVKPLPGKSLVMQIKKRVEKGDVLQVIV